MPLVTYGAKYFGLGCIRRELILVLGVNEDIQKVQVNIEEPGLPKSKVLFFEGSTDLEFYKNAQ